jgi:hypothetical protein
MSNGKGVFFERIRRITGYLVGTLDRWCNAKKAEERDRVVHNVKQPISDHCVETTDFKKTDAS